MSAIRDLAASLLAGVLLLALPGVAGAVPAVCGDVNGSNTVTSSDALSVLKKAVGQPVMLSCPACPALLVGEPVCGDVNASGTVTSSDALSILKKAVGQPVTLTCAACPGVQRYGNVEQLPRDDSENYADYLLGSPVTIPAAATLTDFGVISVTGGTHVRMALYADDGGTPGAFLAGSDSTLLTGGSQEIPVTPTPLGAGTYWILALFDGDTNVYWDDSDASAVVKYRSLSFLAAYPDPFGPAFGYTSAKFNYWITVTP
jgi:hypothetical protein